MRPTVPDLIAGISWSLEEYVFPELNEPLGQSTARSVRNLLAHIQLRLESEGEVLVADNAEKRVLFAELVDRFAGIEPLVDCAASLRAASGRPYREAGAWPSVRSLTEENEALKAALAETIEALQAARAGLPAGVYEAADGAIRAQLRRDLDREHAWILPAFKGRSAF